MSSTRRILASRANGALSKGPKTPEGKLRSARNALTHGLCASTVVPEDETSPAFAALLSEFEQELQPRDLREQTCVQSMALARWRTLRLWRLEKDALEQEMAKQDFEEHCPPPAPPSPSALSATNPTPPVCSFATKPCTAASMSELSTSFWRVDLENMKYSERT